jgi:hypothetical protein
MAARGAKAGLILGAMFIVAVAACGGSTSGGSMQKIPGGPNASSDAAPAGGRAAIAGAANAGGSTDTGGAGGSMAGGPGAGGTTAGSGGATGGRSDSGVPPSDAGGCSDCFSSYDLHWGMDGGLTAYNDLSRIGPCRSYSHERTDNGAATPSSTCHVDLPGCPDRTMAGIIDAFGDPAVQAALSAHALFGNDPRPVDGQVFRIGVGSDYVDIGPSCAKGCAGMPDALRVLATLLENLDATELAVEPCKWVFGN